MPKRLGDADLVCKESIKIANLFQKLSIVIILEIFHFLENRNKDNLMEMLSYKLISKQFSTIVNDSRFGRLLSLVFSSRSEINTVIGLSRLPYKCLNFVHLNHSFLPYLQSSSISRIRCFIVTIAVEHFCSAKLVLSFMDHVETLKLQFRNGVIFGPEDLYSDTEAYKMKDLILELQLPGKLNMLDLDSELYSRMINITKITGGTGLEHLAFFHEDDILIPNNVFKEFCHQHRATLVKLSLRLCGPFLADLQIEYQALFFVKTIEIDHTQCNFPATVFADFESTRSFKYNINIFEFPNLECLEFVRHKEQKLMVSLILHETQKNIQLRYDENNVVIHKLIK